MPFLDESRWFESYAELAQPSAKTPALFLDRDGVVIVEKHYLRDPEQVELYPGVSEMLKSLHELKVPIVLVTNQSGIGQQLFGWPEYDLVHRRMLSLLKMDRPFAAAYANAYHPADTEASWRKPNPGMILQAAADLNICLESSVMVGDKCVDLEAATRAGVKQLIHVKTGHGAGERQDVLRNFPQAGLIDSLAKLNLDLLRRQLSRTGGP